MKSHSWLILFVVLCTTQVHAKPPSKTVKDVEENPTTKATNILKTSAVTEDLRYFVECGNSQWWERKNILFASNKRFSNSETNEDDYYDEDDDYYDDEINDNSSTIQTSTSSAEKTSKSTSTEKTITTSEATIIVKKDEIVLKPIVDPKVRIFIYDCKRQFAINFVQFLCAELFRRWRR